MNARIAINGFGRMGRLVLRVLADRFDHLDIIAINDKNGTAASAAHLLTFDSVHGRWDREVSHEGSSIILGDARIPFTSHADLESLDWSSIDIVLECTGAYRTPEALQPYYDQGIKKVLVACPVKDGALNIVQGVNDHLYDPTKNHLITAASCTTNCLAPVVKVIHEHLGIKHGVITTIHDITNTQRVVDGFHKDPRRARSSSQSLIPTTTGSATAITLIYPELTGRLNGLAVRVPLLTGSLTDCVFELEKKTTKETVNALFEEAANTYLADILGYEERPLVSIDYLNDTRSSIIDAQSTMVIDDTCVKILAWYDNEAGYVNRMAEIANSIAAQL